MYFNDYEVKYGQAVHTHTGAKKQNKNPMQDDACVNVPALLSSPTYDVSSTFYCTLGLPSFEVIGWMLTTEMFSLGRHQMGKHYNLAASSS